MLRYADRDERFGSYGKYRKCLDEQNRGADHRLVPLLDSLCHGHHRLPVAKRIAQKDSNGPANGLCQHLIRNINKLKNHAEKRGFFYSLAVLFLRCRRTAFAKRRSKQPYRLLGDGGRIGGGSLRMHCLCKRTG